MGNKTIYFKDDSLWERAKQLAGKEGMSAVIQEALSDFVKRKQDEAAGFRTYRLLTGYRWILDQNRGGPSEAIKFKGRELVRRELSCPAPDDLEYSPEWKYETEFIVYRTKAGKLVLVSDFSLPTADDDDMRGFSHYGVYNSLRELAEDQRLKQADRSDRVAFLDAVGKQLGDDWAVLID